MQHRKNKMSDYDKYFIGSQFSWTTLDGSAYSGVIEDVDNYTFIVKCDDGVIRAVNGEYDIIKYQEEAPHA
jgi:hypothetical protein